MSQSSTPRKFSEKIAMMMRKQNEDQESFRNVMSDVQTITKKPSMSPGSSDGSPVSGPPTDMVNMMHMPSNYNMQPNMLGAMPPYPMTSWNRPGGSLPNVHQMAQQNPSDPYNNWGYWPPGGQPMPQHHPQPNSYAQSHRTRSPGAQHYHPYRKSNERIPQNDNSNAANLHLQPPDASWSRARSDPTIHMNTVNPNYYYNGQQWTPEMMTNGQHPVQVQQQPQQPNMYQQQQPQQQPQQQQVQHPQAMGYSQQYSQPMVNYPDTSQQMQQPINDMPIGSLPASYMMQHTPSSSVPSPPGHGPMSAGPFTQQQQLSTPAVATESQSAPTSPAQSYEPTRRQQWPNTRHYSASPDTMEIPNIVLTDPDGTFDNCFQGLHLNSDDMRQLMNDQSTLDPSLETQLLN